VFSPPLSPLTTYRAGEPGLRGSPYPLLRTVATITHVQPNPNHEVVAAQVGVAGLAVQQKFPDQVERLRELLRHLASRTAPLQRAAAAVCQQQRPKLGGLLNHARGHGMRLLHGGRHNVHKVR
jgi:hypothetical protein